MPAAIGADFSRAFYPGGMKMRLFLKMVSVSAAAARQRAALRQEYVNSVLGDLRNQLNNTYVMDEKGNKTKLTRWSEDRKLSK